MNIVLTGFRGCGKSSVGKILAQKLGYEFVDCDLVFVEKYGKSIADYVAQNGWPAFRNAETKILQSLLQNNNQVIATGGGIVLTPLARQMLAAQPFTVWLTANCGNIVNRVRADETSRDMRPPLGGYQTLADEVGAVLKEREPLYAACAALRVNTDLLTAEGAADEILKAWRLTPAGF